MLLSVMLTAVSCGDRGQTPQVTNPETEGETQPMEPTSQLIPQVAAGFVMNGTTLTTNYTHEDPAFDFSKRIVVELGATWTLSAKADGSDPIESKAVTLEDGENRYYVSVTFRKETRVYEAIVNYRSAYTVEFYSGGETAVATQVVDKSATLEAPVDPVRQGYTFKGWFLDGVKYDFTDAPTRSCVMIAHWEKNDTSFVKSDTSVPTFESIDASMHAVWKDYADCNGLRPEEVTCILTQRYGNNKVEHEIKLTANGAEWKNPAAAPADAVLTQGEGGAWTLYIDNLPEKCEGRFCSYSLAQVPLSGNYSSKQVGTSCVNTVASYLPSVDQSAKLTTRNSRLYDAAGNMIVLKGVVTLNVNVNGVENSMSFTALERLKDTGCNAIRLTAQVVGAGEGVGYVYFNNGSSRTGDYNDNNATRMTEKGKQMMLDFIDGVVESATELGLYLIIDWGILTSNPYQYINEAKEFFGILAERYASNPYLIYEICNEPKATWGRQNGEENSIKAYAEAVISTIRSKGSDAVVIVAPNNSATALSAYSGGNTAGDDPIDDPLSDDIAYNVAYTFHCYPYNYAYSTYSWKLRDAHQAGLTVITTEMSPMDGTFDSPDTLSFDMEEAAKFMRMYQEWDMSFCYFRYHSAGSKTAAYNENHMFQPGFNLTLRSWTRDDLTECGKWYYDLITGDGVFLRADYGTIQKKTLRAEFDSKYTAYGLGNFYPGFAIDGSISGSDSFFKVNDYDSLSEVLYKEYCKLIWGRINKLNGHNAKTMNGETYTEEMLPKTKEEGMELTYQYNGKTVTLRIAYGANAAGNGYGILLTIY